MSKILVLHIVQRITLMMKCI